MNRISSVKLVHLRCAKYIPAYGKQGFINADETVTGNWPEPDWLRKIPEKHRRKMGRGKIPDLDGQSPLSTEHKGTLQNLYKTLHEAEEYEFQHLTKEVSILFF